MRPAAAPRLLLLLMGLIGATLSAEGCGVVAGIFKAGVWVGLIMAIVVVGLAVVVFSRLRR